MTKAVKGLSVAITTLPLGIDARVKVAESLRMRRWERVNVLRFQLDQRAELLPPRHRLQSLVDLGCD